MRRRLFGIVDLIFVVFLVFVAVVLVTAGARSEAWEYRCINGNFRSLQEQANTLGADGWRL